MSNLFNRLELQAFRAGVTPRTKESRDWFRQKASNLRSINREALMKEDPLKKRDAGKADNREMIGSMQMFFYDPKHKKTLPYYDAFPLVIIIGARRRWVLWTQLALLTSNTSCEVSGCVDGCTWTKDDHKCKTCINLQYVEEGRQDAVL